MRKLIALIIIAVSITSFKTSTFKTNPFIVVIDAGHGGNDDGAQKNGIKEKELTLAIAKNLRDLGDESNVKIILTRKNDDNLLVADRIDLSNEFRGDLFISLHINTNPNTSKEGIDCFINQTNSKFSESKMFSYILVENFKTLQGLKVNEVKSANFKLLEKVKVPAILIELGYISNSNDLNFLLRKENQKVIAANIYKSIIEYKDNSR